MSGGEVRILDEYGRQMPTARERARIAGAGRTRALTGGRGQYSGPAYDAADVYGQHVGAWQPYLWSPDGELNMYRDRIVSRVRDLVRNDGWASGAVTRVLDNAIGAALRPIPKPDYRWLKIVTGSKAFDLEWAKEFSAVLEAHWRSWSNGIGKWCDAARNNEFADLMRIAFRHKLIDGDSLAIMGWRKERIGVGRSRYATCVQLVDPDRLSNPMQVFDQNTMRGGVEIDELGAATHYHIRRAHVGDWFSAAQSMTWDRIPRETFWGRPIVVHDYDGDRASQHRGGAGIFTPIINRMRMLAKYDQAELDSALINTMFGAYIESPFDPQLTAEAFDDKERVDHYQTNRMDYHASKNDIVMGQTRIPILFPGEKVVSTQASHPHGNFEAFEASFLRSFAACVGLSAQQISNNWSDVNYSSARGALLEAWKTLGRRRHDFAHGFCNPIRTCWMEESFIVDGDDYPWPSGVERNFPLFRDALSRCRWLGPAVGWLDPVAEVQSAIMRLDGALSTQEDELAQQGLDFEEVIDQRSYEIKRFDEAGIPRPEWAGALITAAGQSGGGDDGGAQSTGERIKRPPAPKKPEAT